MTVYLFHPLLVRTVCEEPIMIQHDTRSHVSLVVIRSHFDHINRCLAAPFPRNFMTSLRSVYARLFRIFAIVYTNHLPVLEELGALSHLNTSFKHYVIFCWEFDLLKSCEEDALRDLIDEIRRRHLSRK